MSLAAQIREQPVKAREEAERMLGQWAHVVVEAGKLLPLREVTLEEKRKLVTEIGAAMANASACLNIMDLAQKREEQILTQMKEKAGWLL